LYKNIVFVPSRLIYTSDDLYNSSVSTYVPIAALSPPHNETAICTSKVSTSTDPSGQAVDEQPENRDTSIDTNKNMHRGRAHRHDMPRICICSMKCGIEPMWVCSLYRKIMPENSSVHVLGWVGGMRLPVAFHAARRANPLSDAFICRRVDDGM